MIGEIFMWLFGLIGFGGVAYFWYCAFKDE